MDYETKADTLETSFDDLILPPERPVLAATPPAASRAFDGFLRRGEAVEAKSFTGAANADGGYAVPREIDERIDATLKAISQIRRIANVVRVGSAGYRKLVTQNGVASGWAAETAARPETATPAFNEIVPPMGDLYANPAASQFMLDDAAFDVEAWLASEIATEFARAEGAAFVGGNGTNRPRGFLQAYAVIEGLQLGDYGNRIPSLSFEVVADDAPVGVGAMIGALAGVSVDAGPLVTGYAASGPSIRAVAESVAAAFPIVLRAGDTPYVRFSSVPVGSPDPDDLGAHAGEARVPVLATAIAPVEATPAALSLAYLDPARDYQAGLQRARRDGGGMRETRIDLPAVLDADAAHHAAYAALARGSLERTRGTISLPWRAMTLRPGNAIAVGGTDWRISAVQFERMVVALELVRTGEAVAPTGSAEPGRPVAEPDAPQGATTLAVVDLPPLSDTAATRAAVRVFASGVSPGWRRAALLASVDGGASYMPAGSTALPAIMGVTLTALPFASATLIDRFNTVEVALLNDAMTLSDADMPSLLAGANLAMIGNEAIQFGRAEPVAPGRWRLSELWRGRRGTEDAIVPHPAGSRFILVEGEAGVALPADLAIAGVTVMASGIGDTTPFPVASCATASRALMPLSPAALSATMLAGSDTELRWIRRSREGWAWRDGVDGPLAEEREAYRVAWESGVVDCDAPRFAYTAAMRAADIAAGRTTATFAVRQIGSAALSPPVMITIDLV